MPTKRTANAQRLAPVMIDRYFYGKVPSTLESTDKESVLRGMPSFDQASPIADAAGPAAAAVLLGAALYLGPDWALAPLGVESGVRPGAWAVLAVSRLLNASDTFVLETDAGFGADPSGATVAVTAALFCAAGAGSYAALDALFEGAAGFLTAAAACSAIAGGVYEIGRPRAPTRLENDASEALNSAFDGFASARLERCSASERDSNTHRSEIVAAFRRTVGRYRTAEGSGVADVTIERCARSWFRSRGGGVSSAGFFKGCRLLPDPAAL